MSSAEFLGLGAFQWVTVVVAMITSLLAADALAGHYRSGFVSREQYTPFVSGALLIIFSVVVTIRPELAWAHIALRGAAWLAIATGVIGFGFHHYYGIVKKPAGYGWLLYHLMYGAPQLAPLAFIVVGILSLIAVRGMEGRVAIAGLEVRAALFTVVAVALLGAILQAGILHYRGAFNHPLMYAPLTVPVLAVAASVWAAVAPGGAILTALAVLLWLTFLTGFIGLGMHLRGLDRQMGGLYVSLFNLLEGPPAWAPALFAGFAAIGLVAVHLL